MSGFTQEYHEKLKGGVKNACLNQRHKIES